MTNYFALLLVIGLTGKAICTDIEDIWIVPGSEAVRYHNAKRMLHKNTPPLSGDFRLAQTAKQCVEYMITKDKDASKHPCEPGLIGQGENIFMGRSIIASANPERSLHPAINGWYNEIRFVDWKDFEYRAQVTKIGHLTQMLWASSRKVGCAGGSYIKGGYRITLQVCRYTPAGNAFYPVPLKNNVKPLKAGVCQDTNPGFCGQIKSNPKKFCAGPFRGVLEKQCKYSCGIC